MQRETQKLWKFAEQNGLFPFKTIGDVLKENQELKEEVCWLNDVITHNISEIMKQMDALREKEEQQEQTNVQQSEQIDSLMSELDEDITSVRAEHAEDITLVRKDMDNIKNDLVLDPVGN